MTNTVIDTTTFTELRETVGEDFIGELVDAFLDEAPQMLAELRAALDARDESAFRRSAHSLKTNAHTFGAAQLGQRAKELELGGLPDDAARLDGLEADVTAAMNALKTLVHG